MSDVYYQIHTESNGVLIGQWAETDPEQLNNRTRGSTATFDLHVPTDSDDLTVASGTSQTIPAGETRIVRNLVVESNATLTVNGLLIVQGTSNVEETGQIDGTGTIDILSGSADVIDTLLSYDRHAGSYTLSGTLNNTQRYKERLPANPNVESLVVGLEPASGLRNIAGKWGLISNVSDNRTRPLTNPLISLEIDILADYAEYSTITDLQTDLEI